MGDGDDPHTGGIACSEPSRTVFKDQTPFGLNAKPLRSQKKAIGRWFRRAIIFCGDDHLNEGIQSETIHGVSRAFLRT